MKLDGYIRVSRVGGREGEGYISPAVQREAIERYAAELGGEIAKWHDDPDFSGGTLDRPGFQAMLDRIRRDETDGIVVKNIDRFARSLPDGAAIAREIVEAGKVFASCEERIDPRTDVGRYMLNGFLNNAELFLNRIKSGWWAAKAKAIARGAHIGPVPVGYQAIPKGEPLTPHPIYGPAITELFDRAATCRHDDSTLARWMTDRAPREGGQPWQGSEVRRWLKSRIYLGEVRYGDLFNAEAHEPLTDAETFQRAQKPAGAPRQRNGDGFMLAGFVRCACCRYSMGGLAHGGADHATPVYRCGKGRTRSCAEASVIVARPLEDHVLGLVRDHLRGLELEAADAGLDLAALDREASEAEAELEAFTLDLGARRALGEDAWQRALDARVADRDAKRTARDRAYSNRRLVTVARDVDDLDHDDLRDLLRGMVRHVFVRRQPRGAAVADRAFVVWSDDSRPIEVPGPHRSATFEPIRW